MNYDLYNEICDALPESLYEKLDELLREANAAGYERGLLTARGYHSEMIHFLTGYQQ